MVAVVAELLDRANGGDMAAVGALLQQFEGYLEAQLRRQRSDVGRAPGPEIVRDLVQEARMRVLNRIQSGKGIHGGESGFRAFLRDTAYHLWLDTVAGRQRVEIPFPASGDLEDDAGGLVFNPLSTEADPGGDPLQQMLELEERTVEETLVSSTIFRVAAEIDAAHPNKNYARLLELQVESWRREAAGGKRTNQMDMAKAIGCSQAAVSMRLGELFRQVKQRIDGLGNKAPSGGPVR